MTTTTTVLCGSVPHRGLSTRGTRLAFTTLGSARNVHLEISDLNERLAANLPPAFSDLLEIATYVYCADQAVSRGGAGVDRLAARWRRRFHFRIGVRECSVWNSPDMQEALTSTLGFLSDDEYEFEFVTATDVMPVQKYLAGSAPPVEGEFDEVCLFSGGLDSLGGAIEEVVVQGRRAALVTHQPVQKLVARYRTLRAGLNRRARQAPLFVPVTINKDQDLGKETTQRTRSFLYMALGACVARVLGQHRIRFYENGVLSFNLPPAAQVLGAKATRTTHPKVLKGYASILSLLANRPFQVENPFLWKTKTEVVQDIVARGCADLIAFSTSCAHTWVKTLLHPHCGTCSQCIDRRFAVLAAGAADLDPAHGYKVGLLLEERPNRLEQTMLAAYAETANAIDQMGFNEFFAKFGEATRALRHVGTSADEAARRIYDLHKRHAAQVTAAVADAVQTNAPAIVARSLPPYCFVRMVSDPATTPPLTELGADHGERLVQATAPQVQRNIFKSNGRNAWRVCFAGADEFVMFGSKGAAYLRLLLASPGQALSAAKLASTVARQPESYFLGDAGDTTDPSSLTTYEARMEELIDDMREATERGEAAKQELVQKEMNDLTQLIRTAVDVHGRARKAGDNRDCTRKAVAIAIKRAIEEIAKSNRALAQHLQPPTLSRGYVLCYSGSPNPAWEM
jgi:hypothetical protein